MNAVEPIRDYDKILDIANYLKNKNYRDYMMFMIGIYIPIRISDILQLRVRDVKKNSLSIREKKTGKEQMIPINNQLRKIIDEYIKNKADHEFLIVSKKTNKGSDKPITRQQAYNILNDAADHFGLQKIGCHTMRKTFGFHYYQQTKDIMSLQSILNHRDANTTKLYIGLTQKMKNDAIINFKYKKL